MAKPKNKSKNVVEHLQGEIRKLKSENRQLKRRVRELDKKSHFYEKIMDDVTEDVEVKEVCKDCGKGTLITLDLKYVKYKCCDLCDYKEKMT